MATTPKQQKRGVTALGILLLLIFVLIYSMIVLILLLDFVDLSTFLIRFGALVGLTSMSFATLLASDLKFVFRNFGKPFMKIHHIFAILGLIFITVHPVVFAISQMAITVFAPRFDSWIVFWELAGRPAFYLIYLGTIAALLRRKIKNSWRYLHFLNYIVLIFGYVHGVLIGSDFNNPLIFILFTGLILFSLIVPFFKLYKKKRK
jgi:predicted ferric reductase